MRYTTFFLLILFTACGSNVDNPRVVYPQTDTTDSTQINEAQNPNLSEIKRNLYMEFPFAFDSTSAYIFPIKNTYDLRGDESYKLKSGLSSSGYSYPSESSRLGGYQISGWFYNFYFQELPNEDFKKLTNKEIRFSKLQVINDTIQKQPFQILLYDAFDTDSNQDKFLNRTDLRSNYISSATGQDLQKITPSGHYLIKNKFDKRTHRIYFNTIEDADKDGEFLKKDPRHYYYFEILTGKVKEYQMPQ